MLYTTKAVIMLRKWCFYVHMLAAVFDCSISAYALPGICDLLGLLTVKERLRMATNDRVMDCKLAYNGIMILNKGDVLQVAILQLDEHWNPS